VSFLLYGHHVASAVLMPIGVVRKAAVYPRISGGRAAFLGSYLYL
jgi:hypothetical protein